MEIMNLYKYLSTAGEILGRRGIVKEWYPSEYGYFTTKKLG